MIDLIELGEKHTLFCLEYLKDFNGTQAAIRAGYSEKSAYSQAHDLLKKPEVLKYIENSSKVVFNSIGLGVERIFAEIVSVAFSENTSNKDKLKSLELLLKYTLIKDEKIKGKKVKIAIAK